MIVVSPLQQKDLAAVTELWNQTAETLPFSWCTSPDTFQKDIVSQNAEPYIDLQTQPEGCLVARDGKQMLGLIHCSVGYLAEDEITLRGFIRHLTTLPSAPNWVAKLLLSEAEDHFRKQGVSDRVFAFHRHAGYPSLLAGRGYFATDRIDIMATLGDAGYQVRDRWFLYEKTFHSYVTEYHPSQGNLVLRILDSPDGITSLHVVHQGWPVAELSVVIMIELSKQRGAPIAAIKELRVEPGFRRRGVGRWLLLRTLNELTLRGVHHLIVDINHNDAAAQSLLVQLGFEEVPIRGFSYEKSQTNS
ncbi:MAG: GNAT family N-acetyltransferase [Chloroflexi bacterium]|nr:GNAT family N-acetyltransferase [Chloroflexota bacterium]